jgi:hypothetical protein
VHTRTAIEAVEGHVPENGGERKMLKTRKKGHNELYDVINLLVLTTVANMLIDGQVPENADT